MSTPTTPRTARIPSLIVAKREIMVQLTDKAFWIGTLTTIGMVLGGFLLSSWLTGGADDPIRIAVADDDAAAVVQLADTMGTPTEVVRVAEDELHAVVEAEDADAALTFDPASGWTLAMVKPQDAPALDPVIRAYQIDRNAAELGISPEDILAGSTYSVVSLGEEDANATAILVATFVFAMLFLMSALSYGMQIAQSVVTEKESRIVEILAAAVPIRSQLIGKVLGNSVMALMQVVLIVTVALVGMFFTEYKPLISLVAPVAGWFILFFLIGFAALACLWAAAGAMATRVQDLSQTTTPLMMIVMSVYFVGLFATGTLAEVLSYVPIASSVVMPVRLLEGDATWIHALGALAAAVLFMALAIRLGERIYRRGLLQTNGVMKLKEALKAAE